MIARCVLFAFIAAHATSAAAETAMVSFVVEVPADTPKDAALFIAGGHPQLGGWSGSGLALKRKGDEYVGRVKLPVGQTVEYKVTRGSWATVEKNVQGGEIANRAIKVERDAEVRIRVERWAVETEPRAGNAGQKPPTRDDNNAAGRLATPSRDSTRTGDIRHHRAFRSRILENERDVFVYLPPDYEKQKKERYPVLYMHDGQNLFDAATSFLGIEWQADEHAERLIRAGRIRPIIIVGIANTPDRMNEYTPDADATRKAGGKGAAYGRFLVEELKPFIDRTYRTLPGRDDTAVAGSSLGGLISLYLCREHPDVFSMCGVISPALMWNAESLTAAIADGDKSWLHRTRFWVDMGTAEGRQVEGFNRGIDNARRLIETFKSAGLAPGRDFYYQEVYEGRHDEAAWAARFDDVLLFFFARKVEADR